MRLLRFRETGRHLGVFKDEKSADAYAVALHNSEGSACSAKSLPSRRKRPDREFAVLDLSSGPERMQMLTLARTIMNGREADAKAAQRQAHETWYNGFLNQLLDGKLGQADLDSAYKNGQITDFDERRKAQGILDEKNKRDKDLDLFVAIRASGVKANPYDPKAQAALMLALR
jgi:hypothetical protein